jgi:hypothetical protein
VLYIFGIAFAQFLGCSLWFSVNGVSAALAGRLGSGSFCDWLADKRGTSRLYRWNLGSCDHQLGRSFSSILDFFVGIDRREYC